MFSGGERIGTEDDIVYSLLHLTPCLLVEPSNPACLQHPDAEAPPLVLQFATFSPTSQSCSSAHSGRKTRVVSTSLRD